MDFPIVRGKKMGTTTGTRVLCTQYLFRVATNVSNGLERNQARRAHRARRLGTNGLDSDDSNGLERNQARRAHRAQRLGTNGLDSNDSNGLERL
jgi:hypothetical protein